MRERIKARQGDKQDWELVRAAKNATKLKGIPKNSAAVNNMSKAKKGKSIPLEVREKIAATLSIKNSGEGNPVYGTGRLYIELTTNTIGTISELIDKFNSRDIIAYSKLGRPISKGKLKGLHFQVYTS